MNGLAITIIVGQLPKLCGFSTDADGFVDEVRAFVDGFDGRNSTALAARPRHAGRPARAAALHQDDPGRAGRRRRGHRRDGRVRSRHHDRRCAPRGPPPAGAAVDRSRATSDRCSSPRSGITLVSLTDTIATSTSFAARRGDEVDPNQEMIGIGTANIAAGFFQGFAVSTSGSRTAVAEQSGAKSQLTGLVGAVLVALLLLFFSDAARRPAADGAGGRRDRRRDLAGRPRDARAATSQVRKTSLLLSLVATAGVVFFGVLEGHPHRRRAVDPALLPAELVAPRRGARPRSTARTAGTAVRTSPDADAAPRRARVPLGGTAVLRQRRHVPPADPPPRPQQRTPAGWCSSARRSPTSTSPPPTCSSGSTPS